MHSKRIPSLDGLRGISILMVSLSHFVMASNSPLPAWTQQARFLGSPGVDVFFVISGYLITSLLLKEHDRTGRISLTGFYKRRALRIFPAYFAYLGVVLALTLTGLAYTKSLHWLLALTYTVNFIPNPHGWFGQLWSLSVEEHFYLMWPLAVVLLSPRRGRLMLLVWIVLAPILRVLIWTRTQYEYVDIDLFTFTRIDTIATGCVLAYLVRRDDVKRFTASAGRYCSALVLLALGLLYVSMTMIHSGKYTLLLSRFVEASLMASIVLLVTSHPNSAVGRLLNWRPLVFVGVLSYSLYLYQPLLNADWGLPWFGNIGLLIVAACCSYFLIEKPFLRLKGR